MRHPQIESTRDKQCHQTLNEAKEDADSGSVGYTYKGRSSSLSLCESYIRHDQPGFSYSPNFSRLPIMGNKPSQASSESRPHRISRVDLKSAFASFTGSNAEEDRKGKDTTTTTSSKLREDGSNKDRVAEETDDQPIYETTTVSLWLCRWLKLVMPVLCSNRLLFLPAHNHKCQSPFLARFVSSCRD